MNVPSIPNFFILFLFSSLLLSSCLTDKKLVKDYLYGKKALKLENGDIRRTTTLADFRGMAYEENFNRVRNDLSGLYTIQSLPAPLKTEVEKLLDNKLKAEVKIVRSDGRPIEGINDAKIQEQINRFSELSGDQVKDLPIRINKTIASILPPPPPPCGKTEYWAKEGLLKFFDDLLQEDIVDIYIADPRGSIVAVGDERIGLKNSPFAVHLLKEVGPGISGNTRVQVNMLVRNSGNNEIEHLSAGINVR